MAKKKAPAAPATVRVYPHPDLSARNEFLAGVGADGADVEPELAKEWVEAGLAVRARPRASGGLVKPGKPEA
jgi:hypothetical protein